MFDSQKTKAVLWDLDETLYSRRAAARALFPGMFKAYLYPERDDAFLNEAADYMMTRVPRNSMLHEDAFQALLPADRDITAIVLKGAGIAIVSEMGEQLCADAGESALAGRIALASRVAMLGLCAPLVGELTALIGGALR